MPKAIWKGFITFGLVNIPVKVYSSYNPKSLKFKLIHKVCNTPIIYKKFCPTCNKEVDWNEIERAYPLTKTKLIPISKEDFEKVKLKSTKEMEVLEFVDISEIDPIYFQKSYYIVPEGSSKVYFLFVEALRTKNKAADAKVVIRNKEYVVVIRPYRKGLVMHVLYYIKEVRDIEELPEIKEKIVINEADLKLASELIEKLTTSFDLSKYKDEYSEQLLQIIKEKAGISEKEEKEQPTLFEIIKKKVEKEES
ncbi:MAG: Ku protein [Candidatus Aenigmatarchaeota archaeon]